MITEHTWIQPLCRKVAHEAMQSKENEMSDKALFFATMRKPEMRVIRAALWDMKWQHNVPWETITSLEVMPPIHESDVWMLLTDRHQVICYWPSEVCPFFTVLKLHNENDPHCDCDFCKEDRAILAKRNAQAQPTTA